MIIITTIRELRKNKGMKASKLSEKLGISISAYYDKETGRRKFKPNEIVMLCTLFNERVENIKNFYS